MIDPDELNDREQPPRTSDETPAVPAATVVLLRSTGADRFQTLMLRRRTELTFGGMWVFPGGQIDPSDREGASSIVEAARAAAVREAAEEANLVLKPPDLVHFAFWEPPPSVARRFATWFFVTRVDSDQVVTIDDGEIVDHAWMGPAEALDRRDRGEIDMAPPTWVTLNTLARFGGVDAAMTALSGRHPRDYTTKMAQQGDTTIAMWLGDAGYETGDPAVAGPRHRLEMTEAGYRFDESGYRDAD